jgi:phosphatidylglycerophosphate synthase
VERLKLEKEKGASDILAHYVHRPIENWIVRRLVNTKLTPNQLTILINLIAYCVVGLFLLGHLLAGSILTFLVGLMDGLDGKLARARGEATKLGSMEHVFDLLFEFLWLVALALYLFQGSGSPLPLILCLLAVVFMAFYRTVYDRFTIEMRTSLDNYGRFERTFRRMAGRRNLYNIHILVGVLLGVPLYSLFSILIHSALTAVVYAYRACKNLHLADKAEKRNKS